VGEVRRCNTRRSAGEDSRNGIGEAHNNCNLHLSPFGNRTPRERSWEAFCILHHHATRHFNLSVLVFLCCVMLFSLFFCVMLPELLPPLGFIQSPCYRTALRVGLQLKGVATDFLDSF